MYEASNNHIQCCLPQESELTYTNWYSILPKPWKLQRRIYKTLSLHQTVHSFNMYRTKVSMCHCYRWYGRLLTLIQRYNFISTIGMNSVLNECIPWGICVIVPPEGHDIILTQLDATNPGVSKMKSLARCFIR